MLKQTINELTFKHPNIATRINNTIANNVTIIADEFSLNTILCNLIEEFGDLSKFNIVEIGGGYGGQCKIISDYFKIKKYVIYDLPEVNKLQKKYLNKFNINNIFLKSFKSIEKEDDCDIIISNYALSECNKNIQDVYFNNVINYSKMGFMIWNETKGSYTYEDIYKMYNYVKIKNINITKNKKTKLVTWKKL